LIALENHYQTSLSSYTFIDLFAGIGGFRYALESFGAQCLFSSEIDKHARAVYKENHGDMPHGDITNIDEKMIPKHTILCGGFPCQAFSISGKQKGFEDTRGTLFFEIARIVKLHTPKLLLLENVRNFIRHDNGKTLQTVIDILNNLGYKVFYELLNASHFGVPQSRQRVYIVAFHHSLKVNSFDFPKSNGIRTTLMDFLDDNDEIALEKYIIKRDDIKIKEGLTVDKDSQGFYFQRPIRVGTINKGGQGERIYHSLGHAITLSAYGGGIAGKTGCYEVNGIYRRLTEKEIARISGYPSDFKAHPSKNQSYKQFGNSVVINVLQEIIKKVIDENCLRNC
jgi:DNA (cytosine-5)-methyltransferase 1